MHVGELYLGNYTRGRGRVNPDNGTDWKEIKQMFGEKKKHKYIREKSLTVQTFKQLWGYLLKIWISRKQPENLNKYKAWCSHQYPLQVPIEDNGKEDGAGGCGTQWTRVPTRVRSSTKGSILAEFCPSGFSHCYWLLGEAHSLKLPTLARYHSNHLHELF